ncbi:MAG: hypothetical protein JNL32_15760 [Candidatus Kapabacteria bacterium]|nr:hypothetical protein [Candidatus Kapabacteria bacterium]
MTTHHFTTHLLNTIWIATLLLSASIDMFSQCSDGGVCSIGNRSHQKTERLPNHIGVSIGTGYSGKADDVRYTTVRLSVNEDLNDNMQLQISVPYNMQSGPLGRTQGIGDPIASYSYTLLNGRSESIRLQVGVRIGFGAANVDSLPMAYQNGLGSTDLIFGASYNINEWNISAGFQLAGRRNNNITHLQRGNDVLVRAGYTITYESFRIMPEILGIHRLSESTSQSPSNDIISIPGSQQSQINIALDLKYVINTNITVQLFAASPLLQRKNNIDGLTRAFTLQAGAEASF